MGTRPSQEFASCESIDCGDGKCRHGRGCEMWYTVNIGKLYFYLTEETNKQKYERSKMHVLYLHCPINEYAYVQYKACRSGTRTHSKVVTDLSFC